MSLLALVWAASCVGIFGNFSLALAVHSKATADIVLDGSHETAPPSDYNPLLAQIHIPSSSATNNDSNVSRTDVELEPSNQKLTYEGPSGGDKFSLLQSSSKIPEDSAECSCMFAGMCLYKGACLWIAGSLAFGVVVLVFLIGWALQWIVAIPAEWILAKHYRRTPSEGKSSGSHPTDTAQLFGK